MTLFKDMKFPDWEYREFPLAVPMLAGKPTKDPYDPKRPGKLLPVVIVENEEALEKLLAGAKVNTAERRLENEDDAREDLYVTADQIGAKIDKRWSVAKIEAAIADRRAEMAEVL